MSKETKFEFNTDWYELWMKQSKDFYTSAEKNLKDMFEKNDFIHPEAHTQQINQWVEALKKQWQANSTDQQNKMYENYLTMMNKIYSEASDLMVEQWIKRTQQANPVKNIFELYEIWLNACHDLQQKYMQSKHLPKMYSDFMDVAMKFWKSSLVK